MKLVQIALLVVAGALSGAVVMKVWQRSHVPAAPAAVVAKVIAPEPVVTQPPEPPAPPAVVPAVKRRVEVYHAPRRPSPQPMVIARIDPRQAPPPPPLLQLSQEPKDSPTPPMPPARIEPENVTPPAPPPPPEPHKVTLNAGTLIPVRLVDGLSTERNRPGDVFTATLDKELVAGDFVIAERGARVEGRVLASDPGGKVKGVAALSVALTGLNTSDGQSVAIRTDAFERRAEPSHGEDAQKVATGAAVGAIVGAIAGGGKGAAIGAGVGGGAGAGGVLLTRGKPVTLPSETRVTFRLQSPVTLTERQ